DSCVDALFRDAEFFHKLIKSWPADPKVSSCGSNSPGMSLQRLLDHVTFHLLARFLQRSRSQYAVTLIQLEILCGHSGTTRHDDAAFHTVLQLADIARPGIAGDCAQRVGREHHVPASALSGIPLQKLARQKDDVFASLTKRQQPERNNRKAKI